MAEDIKTLKYRRGTLKSTVTRLKTYFESVQSSTNINNEILEQLSSRLADFEPVLNNFNELQEKIDILLLNTMTPSNVTTEQYEQTVLEQSYIERNEFEDSFHGIIARVRVFISKHKTKTSDSVVQEPILSQPVRQIDANCNVKFPQINLPTFTGHYHDGMEFHDTFQSLIHNNISLDDIQKLYYLKSCLKGEAANVVKSVEVSASNYVVAWSLLNDRYENKRLITNKHIRTILEFKNISKESSIALRSLSDELNKNVRCLKALGHPVESWSTLLIQIIVSKLDQITRREWEQVNIEGTYPTFEEFSQFLKRRCELLEAVQANNILKSEEAVGRQGHFNSFKLENQERSYVVTGAQTCVFCKNSHLIYNCPEFLNLSVASRSQEIKKRHLCFNCLRTNHQLKDCHAMTCRKCNKKHHTLLHFENSTSIVTNTNQTIQPHSESKEDSVLSNHSMCHSTSVDFYPNQSLLATVVVSIKDNQSNLVSCRALLDCGSQSNFVTESFCRRLNLQMQNVNVSVAGISNISSLIRFKVDLELHSNRNNFESSISCLVLKQITDYLPSQSLNISKLNIPSNIQLADPEFNKSRPVDLLLGVSTFWQVLCAGQIHLGENLPILQKQYLDGYYLVIVILTQSHRMYLNLTLY